MAANDTRIAKRYTITVTTDGSGDATSYVPDSGTITGTVLGIYYTKDDYAAGVDFDVTVNGTGETVWDEDDVNASKNVRPAVLAQGTDGADLTGVYTPVLLVDDKLKIVISSGGASKSGSFTVLFD